MSEYRATGAHGASPVWAPLISSAGESDAARTQLLDSRRYRAERLRVSVHVDQKNRLGANRALLPIKMWFHGGGESAGHGGADRVVGVEFRQLGEDGLRILFAPEA